MPAPESVVLETSLGNIQLELYWDHAPRVCLSVSQSSLIDQPLGCSDLRKLRAVGEAWLLQRPGIPPHCSRMLSVSSSSGARRMLIVYV